MKNIFLFALLFFFVSAQSQAGEVDVFFSARTSMVEEQLERRGITDRGVLQAMKKVERHLFVPEHLEQNAYIDRPLPIRMGQTISQPYIVALMTELLELEGNERVLEIGTGSGYQAAVLGELVKEVYTVEIVGELAERSAQLLRNLGYSNVKVKHGDGFLGWQEFAPYDAIMVTCAPEEVPQPLLDQLSEGGRLVIPVGSFFQELKLIEKTDGVIKEEVIAAVRFVPMVRDESTGR